MRNKLTPILVAALALPILLTSCSPVVDEKTEDISTQTVEEIREEQPKEVNAIENSEPFYKTIDGFIDLKEFETSWLQIAPMVDVQEDSGSEVWFANTTPELAIDISNKIIKSENWASVKESAPQTPEEQLAARDIVIEEDPLNMSGTIHLTDGSSLSVTVYLDDSQEEPFVQYMFSATKV